LEGLIVREYGRMVYRIAFSVLRNPHDAEDVVQEVLLRVLRSRHRLKHVDDLSAYIARTAWHVALDSRCLRSLVSLDSSPNEEGWQQRVSVAESHDYPDVEQGVSDREILRFVENAIADLPTDLRDAIILSTIEELSAAEAGKLLGVAEATVRTRVFRARQILREKLVSILEKHHA
jgi:RNA polymerase sigma-70 factor (ECF subfamily)